MHSLHICISNFIFVAGHSDAVVTEVEDSWPVGIDIAVYELSNSLNN
jgi:alpha-D-ribose 1-methylphosphonate 5-triphosphate diphosphatase PhnM